MKRWLAIVDVWIDRAYELLAPGGQRSAGEARLGCLLLLAGLAWLAWISWR